MRNKVTCRFTVLVMLAFEAFVGPNSTAVAQGTAFTYQGRLNDGTNTTRGSYDLVFTVFSASSGGAAVAGPLTNSAVAVSNGLFVATLDFGVGVFTGAGRWLE